MPPTGFASPLVAVGITSVSQHLVGVYYDQTHQLADQDATFIVGQQWEHHEIIGHCLLPAGQPQQINSTPVSNLRRAPERTVME
jgi:hypothetical protein